MTHAEHRFQTNRIAVTPPTVEYQDAVDGIRIAEDAKRTYEFEELMGQDRSELIADCDRIIRENTARIEEILLDLSIEDANRAQWALVVEWAKRLRRNPDDVAHLWIRQFSRNFRNLWESGVRDHASLLANVYRI